MITLSDLGSQRQCKSQPRAEVSILLSIVTINLLSHPMTIPGRNTDTPKPRSLCECHCCLLWKQFYPRTQDIRNPYRCLCPQVISIQEKKNNKKKEQPDQRIMQRVGYTAQFWQSDKITLISLSCTVCQGMRSINTDAHLLCYHLKQHG